MLSSVISAALSSLLGTLKSYVLLLLWPPLDHRRLRSTGRLSASCRALPWSGPGRMPLCDLVSFGASSSADLVRVCLPSMAALVWPCFLFMSALVRLRSHAVRRPGLTLPACHPATWSASAPSRAATWSGPGLMPCADLVSFGPNDCASNFKVAPIRTSLSLTRPDVRGDTHDF